jgi:hypothetical protein
MWHDFSALRSDVRRSGMRGEKGSGAQGRNRTTDTAIFSRMLYQLSYLGTRGTQGHSPRGSHDQAARQSRLSGGPSGPRRAR